MSSAPAPALSVVRRPRVMMVAAAVVAIVLVGAGAWYRTHPSPLLVRSGHVTAVTTPNHTVYVGVWSAPPDRTISIAGVHLHADSTVQVDLAALVCHGGTPAVTTDPSAFCTDLVDPEGATLAPGDSLLLRATTAETGAVYVDRPLVSYVEGRRTARQPAGSAAVIAVVDPVTRQDH